MHNRVIRVPEHLILLANKKSENENISTNQYIVNLIEKDLSEHKQDRIIAENKQQIVLEEIKNNLQITLVELLENQLEIIKKLRKINGAKE